VFLENCHVHAAKITKHLLEYGIGSRNTQATSQAKPSASPELNRQIEMNPES
jgi:thioredoxin reductase (NADPH)